jgi:hypothetical protein
MVGSRRLRRVLGRSAAPSVSMPPGLPSSPAKTAPGR